MTTPARTPDSKVAPHAVADGVAAPIGVEALKVEPQLPGALPQVRILEPPLVGEQQVVHLPEATLERRPPRPRMPPPTRADGWSARGSDGTRAAASASRSAELRGAIRALEVRVLDHQRRVIRPRDVVLGATARDGRRAAARSTRAGGSETVEDQVGAGQLVGSSAW